MYFKLIKEKIFLARTVFFKKLVYAVAEKEYSMMNFYF